MSADAGRRARAEALGGTTAAGLVLAALVSCAANAAAADADRRAIIWLDAEARGELLAEMRAHVVNVQRILEAVSRNDLAAAERAARASGLVAASEAGDEMGRRLPRPFTALGMSLHEDFDRLADGAARGADARVIVGGLAVAMQKCVACHASYRIGSRATRAPTR
jgi:cytochrome c556